MSPFSSLAFLFLVLVCAVSAHAQSDNLMRQPEVFGQFGMARVGADESSMGTGPALGASLMLPVLSKLAFDIDVQATETTRAFSSGVEFGARQLLISPAVVYRWPVLKGYVFAGGGLGHEWTKEKHAFPDDPFYQSYSTAPTVGGTTLVGKTGYVVPVKGRLLVRIDFLVGFRHVLPHTGLRIGAGFRFR